VGDGVFLAFPVFISLFIYFSADLLCHVLGGGKREVYQAYQARTGMFFPKRRKNS